MEKLKDALYKVKGGWNSIDKKRRGALIFAFASLSLFMLFYSWQGNRASFTPLFTNLELKDAADIAQDLDAKGNIKYELRNGGRDIYIDAQHVDRYRLDLAMNGMIPQNSTGFEIFDNMGMMVTDEDRKIMYQRALEGELQRTIMSLSEIETARVHLVMSRESVFNSERREASASVVLDIRRGATLPTEAIHGILALVAGAVDNLPEGNVRIIDARGNLLSDNGRAGSETSGFELLGKQSEVKQSFEKELRQNILGLLGPAFGPDKVMVSVYADLDFDATEKTVIQYENPVIRSEQKSATGSGINGEAVMDDPVGDNVQNVLDGNDGDNLSSFDGTVNYELTESRTSTVRAPGAVTRITTSVLFDGQLNAAQRETITNLVATATGYDVARGDMISVEGVVFDRTYQEEIERELQAIRDAEQGTVGFMERYRDQVYFGVFGFLSFLFFIAFLRAMLGAKKREDEKESYRPQPISMQEPLTTVGDVLERFEVKEDPKEQQLKTYAKEHPEAAADLIKAWMKD